METRIHRKKVRVFLSLLTAAIMSCPIPFAFAESHEVGDVPVKGMVTMIDLGRNKCLPCKMMEPIMEKLEKRYNGKAAIILIDIAKDYDRAKQFTFRSIPTQIFFDKEGKEVHRHVGFMSEEAIVEQLKKMGVR